MDKLRSIQVFCEVVRRGSFSAAAESLQLVNSAVSRQVSELEQWLGSRLLYRTTRNLSLTEEGKGYLTRFESLLSNLAEIEQLAGNQRDEVTGSLQVTTFPFMAHHFLNPVLSSFHSRYPKVRINLMQTERFVSLVDEGFDLAIRVGELPDSSLIARQLGLIWMRTVASPTYLEQYGVPKHPEDLQQHNCLYDTVLERHNRRWTFRRDGRTISVPVDGNLSINAGEMVCDMASAGHGIAYLPDFIAAAAIADGRLVELLPEYNQVSFPIAIVYPQNRQMSRPLRLLIDELVDYYPRIGKT